jgi:hypothetical protein
MNIVSHIVCWKCRKGNLQLFNVRNELGKKTRNYVCVNCKKLQVFPEIDDMSQDYTNSLRPPVTSLEGDLV